MSYLVGFEVFTAVVMKRLWVKRRLGGNIASIFTIEELCLLSTSCRALTWLTFRFWNGAICSSETMVNFLPTIRHYIQGARPRQVKWGLYLISSNQNKIARPRRSYSSHRSLREPQIQLFYVFFQVIGFYTLICFKSVDRLRLRPPYLRLIPLSGWAYVAKKFHWFTALGTILPATYVSLINEKNDSCLPRLPFFMPIARGISMLN
jgi:hypothetical protein